MEGYEEVEICGFGNCCGYGNFKAKKKISTKNKVQGMAVWCKFVTATANEKSSSRGSSQDVEAVAVVLAPAENSSQSSLSDQLTDSQTQAAATKEVKTRPTPKTDELKEKMGIEKDILLGLYRKREHGMLSSQDSDKLKKKVSKKAKLENELKAVETNRLRPKNSATIGRRKCCLWTKILGR